MIMLKRGKFVLYIHIIQANYLIKKFDTKGLTVGTQTVILCSAHGRKSKMQNKKNVITLVVITILLRTYKKASGLA